jgi:hypothetical protein
MESNWCQQPEGENESRGEAARRDDRRPYTAPRLAAHGNLAALICATPGGKGVAVFAGYGRTF